MFELKLDCRHFRGDKPCAFACPCGECAHYEPMGTRILIVKLDAIGDVARTTTILRPLRNRYAPCHLTWLVAPAALEVVEHHPLIEVPLSYGAASLERLRVETFDLVLSLDKTPRAASVAMNVAATRKLGFGLSRFGTVYPLNEDAEYALAKATNLLKGRKQTEVIREQKEKEEEIDEEIEELKKKLQELGRQPASDRRS
jgi:heptosyltransferase-2